MTASPDADALRREADRSLTKFAVLGAIYLVMAGLCAVGVPYAYVMQHGSGLAVYPGEVVALEPLAGEDRLMAITAFVDDEGVRHTTRDSASMLADARIGAKTMVLYRPGEQPFVRIVNAGERAMRMLFIGCVAVLLALAAGLLAFGLRRRATRRWLLRHGRVVEGMAPRVVDRPLPIPQAPPQWAVRASWLDPSTATWREVRTDWHVAAVYEPVLPDGSVVVYVDPSRPRRAWMPATPLRRRIAGK